MLPTFVAAGAGFLCAVLWFDLMFDVQVRGRAEPSVKTLDAISAYYRRVTTEASPMGRLVSLVMLATLASIAAELVRSGFALWWAWASLAAALSAIGLAVSRTVPNAVRLGRADDPDETRVRLARATYRDHLFCLTAMALVLVLQLAGAALSPRA